MGQAARGRSRFILHVEVGRGRASQWREGKAALMRLDPVSDRWQKEEIPQHAKPAGLVLELLTRFLHATHMASRVDDRLIWEIQGWRRSPGDESHPDGEAQRMVSAHADRGGQRSLAAGGECATTIMDGYALGLVQVCSTRSPRRTRFHRRGIPLDVPP